MPYDQALEQAANRHFEAADKLFNDSNRFDVAGYLFGLAAECALKEAMIQSGMRPQEVGERKNDPFFAHFQVLKTMLMDTASGRLRGEIRKIAENNSFMQNWDISMRYSDGKSIKRKWVEDWRQDALKSINLMVS